MKKNVVVIFGGDSSEHDVSCLSATTVIKNMDTEKYNVILVGITKEGRWLLVDGVKDIEDGSWREGEVKAFISPDTTTRSLVILAEGTYKLQKVDVIFPVLHGMNGEDGTVQGLFELSKKFHMLDVVYWHQQFQWIKYTQRSSSIILESIRQSLFMSEKAILNI